jgi:hypothetical protein
MPLNGAVYFLYYRIEQGKGDIAIHGGSHSGATDVINQWRLMVVKNTAGRMSLSRPTPRYL